MARVTWRGETFAARPIAQNADGSWLMEATQHTGRTAPGTHITVQPSEIVAGTMPAAGQSDTTQPLADNGQAALDAAMAEERKTLPTPAQLIAQFQAERGMKQGDPGAVPLGPMEAPQPAPTPKGKRMRE